MFSIEHILPHSEGGDGNLQNLALACQLCNNYKYTAVSALDPVTGHITTLYNPRQHQWGDHFLWNNDFTLIIGKTAVGRATVAKLQLNRQSVVNLREVLAEIGKHPP